MSIPVTCKQCGKMFAVDDRHAGKRGKCGKCGSVVPVPSPQTVAEINSAPDVTGGDGFETVTSFLDESDVDMSSMQQQELPAQDAESPFDRAGFIFGFGGLTAQQKIFGVATVAAVALVLAVSATNWSTTKRIDALTLEAEKYRFEMKLLEKRVNQTSRAYHSHPLYKQSLDDQNRLIELKVKLHGIREEVRQLDSRAVTQFNARIWTDQVGSPSSRRREVSLFSGVISTAVQTAFTMLVLTLILWLVQRGWRPREENAN